MKTVLFVLTLLQFVGVSARAEAPRFEKASPIDAGTGAACEESLRKTSAALHLTQAKVEKHLQPYLRMHQNFDVVKRVGKERLVRLAQIQAEIERVNELKAATAEDIAHQRADLEQRVSEFGEVLKEALPDLNRGFAFTRCPVGARPTAKACNVPGFNWVYIQAENAFEIEKDEIRAERPNPYRLLARAYDNPDTSPRAYLDTTLGLVTEWDISALIHGQNHPRSRYYGAEGEFGRDFEMSDENLDALALARQSDLCKEYFSLKRAWEPKVVPALD